MDAKSGVAVLEPLFGRLSLDLSGERGWEGVGVSEEFLCGIHGGSDQNRMPLENGQAADEFRNIPQGFKGRHIGQVKGNGCLLVSDLEVVDDVVGSVDRCVRVVQGVSECGECLVEVGVIEFEGREGGVQTEETEFRFDEEVEFEVGGGGGRG